MPELLAAEPVAEPINAPPETPATPAPGPETPVAPEPQEPEQPEEQLPEAAQAEQTEGDGRTLPAAMRALLAEVKKTNPKLSGQLRDMWFQGQQLRATFPGGLPEVVKVKEELDAIGGLDGIQTIRTEAQATKAELEKIDTGFANGDAAVLDTIIKQSPEGFAKLMPTALEHFAKVDAEGYQHSMARVVVNTLDAGPLGQAYNALAQLGQENPQVKAIADTLAQWYNGIAQLASKVPEKKVDTEREKFQTERQQWEQQKAQEFTTSVAKEGNAYSLSAIERTLASEFNARGMNLDALKKGDPESFQILLNNCDAAVGRVITADQGFQQNYRAILASRNKEQAVQYAKAKIDKVVAEAVRKTYKAFYTLGGGKAVDNRQKTQAAQATRDIGPGAAPVKLDKMPQPEEIDRARLPKGYRTIEDALLDGKAYLKGKKELVSF
jgi:hypothetical protein